MQCGGAPTNTRVRLRRPNALVLSNDQHTAWLRERATRKFRSFQNPLPPPSFASNEAALVLIPTRLAHPNDAKFL